MIWNLLSAATSVATSATSGSATSSGAPAGGCTATAFIPWLLIIAAMVVLWFFSKRSQQKREQEINDTLNAIQPGNKVKTIGGICGVVVEVCSEDNTFILETGSENSGKSYIKLDKKAVYQTDANKPVEEEVPAKEEETVEETPFEEVGAPVEDAPVEETEATPAEEAAEAPVEEEKEE